MPDPSQTPAPGNEVPRIPLSRAGYSPAVNYQLQCAGCHLPQGQGAPRNDVPRMTGFVGNFLRVGVLGYVDDASLLETCAERLQDRLDKIGKGSKKDAKT